MENIKLKNIYKIITFALLFYFSIENLGYITRFITTTIEMLRPFIVGGVIAFVINVPMVKIEKALPKKIKKARRVIAWLLTILLLGGLITLFITIVMPQLLASIIALVSQLEVYYKEIPNWLNKINQEYPELVQFLNIDWQQIFESTLVTIQQTLMTFFNKASGLVVSLISGVTTGILAFIFSIYILFSKEKLYTACKDFIYVLLKKEKADKLYYLFSLINKSFAGFISGQVLESFIVGFIFMVVLNIFKFPYASLIATMIGFGSIIPIFGAFMACVVGMLLIATQSLSSALWFFVLFQVIQQIEGNLIYPHVVGGSIGLPSILVFFAVIFGGNVMGVYGMLLFIPLTGVIFTLIKEFVKKSKLENKNLEETVKKALE